MDVVKRKHGAATDRVRGQWQTSGDGSAGGTHGRWVALGIVMVSSRAY